MNVIILRGPLGIGKSTISRELAKILSAKVIEIDQIIDEHNLDTDLQEGYISEKSFLKANKLVKDKLNKWLLEKAISNDSTILIAGNFYWKSQLDDLKSALSTQHKVTIITLKGPLELCLARDFARKNSHGEIATKVVYSKSTEFFAGAIIDASQRIETICQEIIQKTKDQ